jgi:cell division protein FtsL
MIFSGALALLLVLSLVFCVQHYRAIEYGYQNAALQEKCRKLLETRRQLQVDEARLREPWRIDDLARQMGLQPPVAGQVVNLEVPPAGVGGTVMAQVAAVSVISATQ